MLNQEEIRLRLRYMIDTYGTKNKFIADKVKLDPSYICKLLKEDNEQELSQDALTRIDKFLKDRNL